MEALLEIRARVLADINAVPMVAAILRGDGTRAAYAHYLTNVWHYAQHSAKVIALAGARCVPDRPALAQYLFHHAQEELGHEAWALEDLAALGADLAQVRASRPVPSCAAMIGYEYFVAGHAPPSGIFGWLYVLEAMGDDLGRVAAQRLRAGFGIERGVKFLAGHGEADEAHTADLTVQISQNVPAEDMPHVVHVAEVVATLYAGMFREIDEATR